MRGVLVLLAALWLIMGTFESSADETAKPIVIYDGWWAVDYAKDSCSSAMAYEKENKALIAQLGCAAITSCPEMTPRVDACRFDPTGGLGSFQIRLSSQFASDSSCIGVQYGYYAGPGVQSSKELVEADSQPHWGLIVDFIPGAAKQPWNMIHGSTMHEGEGTPREIAAKVCAIARGNGARVLQ